MLTLIWPGYSSSFSILLTISLATIVIWSSEITSGLTIILTSLPAWIANDFSTPSNEVAISSSFWSLWIYVSTSSRLAPGLAAEIASAAWTIAAIRVLASTSPWWAWIAWTTCSFSLFFFAASTPNSTWEPSYSWSSALPISWRRPARFAS